MLGPEETYYSPCGHKDIQPLSAYAGITVRVSGIPASQHDAFEKALLDQTSADLNALPQDQYWQAFITWDSRTSSTGLVDVGVDCVPVGRWP